mgnify:CR=1 FL=1
MATLPDSAAVEEAEAAVLDAAAELLLEKEKISREEFEALFEEKKSFFENA